MPPKAAANPQPQMVRPPKPAKSAYPPLSRPWSYSENEEKYLDGPGFFPVDSFGRRLECYHGVGSCTKEDPAIYYGYPFRDEDMFFWDPEQRICIEREFKEICKLAGLRCMVLRREPHHWIAWRDEDGYVDWVFDDVEWRWRHKKGHIYIRRLWARSNRGEATPLQRINHPEFGRIPAGPIPHGVIPLVEVCEEKDYWDPDDKHCMQFWLTPRTAVVDNQPADEAPAPAPYAPAPPFGLSGRGSGPPPPPPGVSPEVWQSVVQPWDEPPAALPQPLPAQNPQNPQNPKQPTPNLYDRLPQQLVIPPLAQWQLQYGPRAPTGMPNWQTQQQSYLNTHQQMHQLQSAQQQVYVDPFANPPAQIGSTAWRGFAAPAQEPQWSNISFLSLRMNLDQTLARHTETNVEYQILDRKYYTEYNGRWLEYDPLFSIHRDVESRKCYRASVINGRVQFEDAVKPAGAFT